MSKFTTIDKLRSTWELRERQQGSLEEIRFVVRENPWQQRDNLMQSHFPEGHRMSRMSKKDIDNTQRDRRTAMSLVTPWV